MKKGLHWAIGIILILVIILLTCRVFLDKEGEDSWIKDSRGVFVEHGYPSNIPDMVVEQQNGVTCALKLYYQAKENNTGFNSQCLGTCANYAVDIVNVPRNSEDEKAENQCESYKTGISKNFIELDKNGDIVKIS